MKSKTLLLFTLLFISKITFCASQNFNEAKIIISGKVLNFQIHNDHTTINFSFLDLLRLNKKKTAVIQPDGTFQIATSIAYPQDFTIHYGAFGTLYGEPGDTLYLEVDANIWENTKDLYPNGEYFIQIAGGTSSEANKHVLRFLQKLNALYEHEKELQHIKDDDPEKYKNHISQRGSMYKDVLTRYISQSRVGDTFKKWAMDYIHYKPLEDLMRYRWYHADLNGLNSQEYQYSIPKAYFSFLEAYNMNDNGVISGPHAGFLHQYFMYSKSIPMDSVLKAQKLFKEKKLVQGAKVIGDLIVLNTSGFTRDLFLAKYYTLALDGQQFKEFEALYDSAAIKNTYFLNILSQNYQDLKAFLANQDVGQGVTLKTINDQITSTTIDSILSSYKGKVVYIDFWAPWCGPCMKEMPYYADLQKYYSDKDVVFLFLANGCSEDSWKATIANKAIKGEHIRLTDDQYNMLAEEFNIVGIPHYIIVNQNGTVVLNNAPRPGEYERLIEELNKLLK